MQSTADTDDKAEPQLLSFFPKEKLFTANNIMTGRLSLFLPLLCLVLQAASQVVVTGSAMDEADEVLTTKVRNLESRIVGGVKADPKRNPYFTQLMITYVSSTTIATGNCGGTLINSDVVLTAAHCLTPDSPYSSVYSIRTWVNSTSIYDSPYEYYRTASRYLIHPSYDHTNLINDVALIFLDTRVTGVTLAKISKTANSLLLVRP
ncbi:trypsin-like serine protease [Fragilaria crotonensis]|nr:trypsin-like serine protease [Fragilaria crotonensis]